jgi:hypothetical protein
MGHIGPLGTHDIFLTHVDAPYQIKKGDRKAEGRKGGSGNVRKGRRPTHEHWVAYLHKTKIFPKSGGLGDF